MIFARSDTNELAATALANVRNAGRRCRMLRQRVRGYLYPTHRATERNPTARNCQGENTRNLRTSPFPALSNFPNLLILTPGSCRNPEKCEQLSFVSMQIVACTVTNGLRVIERMRENSNMEDRGEENSQDRTQTFAPESCVSGVASRVRIEGRRPTNQGRPIDRDEGRKARWVSRTGGRTPGVAAQAAAPSKALAPLEPAKRIPDATEETTSARRSRDTLLLGARFRATIPLREFTPLSTEAVHSPVFRGFPTPSQGHDTFAYRVPRNLPI